MKPSPADSAMSPWTAHTGQGMHRYLPGLYKAQPQHPLKAASQSIPGLRLTSISDRVHKVSLLS